MKKRLLLFCGVAMMFAACKKSDVAQDPANEPEVELAPTVSGRHCAADEVLQADIAAHPERAQQLAALETFTARAIESGELGRLVNGVIEIPVVFNVLYRSSAENISDAQLQSQIDVLNEDFNLQNADHTNTPAAFSGLKANVGIRFVKEKVVRKSSSKRSWSTNDDMKRSSRGGIDPYLPSTHLNYWVVNKITDAGRTILGYAQFPTGPLATDGVVICYNYTGRTGTVSAPFHKGRTATHEVGHWLNLRHIWGDDGGACSGSDLVGDTPNQAGENYGCPAFPRQDACTPSGNGVLYMNYMDYTDDACMFMFSTGQKDRMMALFASGGPRAAFAQ